MTASTTPPLTQQLARWGWGAGLILAGTGHLTFVREEFRSQVPPWVPIDADDVVLLSGAAEIALGLGLLVLPKERRKMAALTTAFLAAVFPGNIAQYRHRVDGLGLDTDGKRLGRLFLQPVLCATALHAGGLLPGARRR
jgi:uncharacterized membrane protein